jgi:hypothetical protein
MTESTKFCIVICINILVTLFSCFCVMVICIRNYKKEIKQFINSCDKNNIISAKDFYKYSSLDIYNSFAVSHGIMWTLTFVSFQIMLNIILTLIVIF